MHDFDTFLFSIATFSSKNFQTRKTLFRTDGLTLILLFSFIRGIAKSYGNTEHSCHRLLGNNVKLITVLSTSSRLHYRVSTTFINDVVSIVIIDICKI